MKYLPDTNALSLHLRGLDPPLSALVRGAIERSELVFSWVVYAELQFGAEKTRRAGELRPSERVKSLARILIVEPLPLEAVAHYASVRVELERAGQMISTMDLLIAAHALALGATVVTHNTREYARVPGLKLENWQTPRRR